MTLSGMWLAATVLCSIAWASPSPSAPIGAEPRWLVRGRVRTAGTREDVADASIFVVPDSSEHRAGAPLPARHHLDPSVAPAWIAATTSDSQGAFETDNIVGRRVRLVVMAPGYERFEQIVEASTGEGKALHLFIRPDPNTAYRTIVAPPRRPMSGKVTSRSLSPAEIATLPGTHGDALRALQNFPGVARPPGGLGVLVLRGASPNQSRVMYGEHALPRAFHALALASVVPADAIDSIDFMPSNAPARYGETTGGVVAIGPARLDHTEWHGHGEVDLAGGGASASGPIGRGGFLVAANRGWVDGAIGMAGLIDSRASYTMPRYADYQVMYGRPVGRGARIEGRILGATDRVQTRFYDPAEGRHRVATEIQTQFHRADIVLSQDHGRWHFMVSPSFRVELNLLESPGMTRTRRTDLIASWRAEVEYRASRRASILVGSDTEFNPFRTHRGALDLQGDTIDGSTQSRRGRQTRTGLYATADLKFGRISLWPALRLNAYTLGSDAETAGDPRFAGRWQASERWAWMFGAGVYSQSTVQQHATESVLGARLTGLAAGGVILPAAADTLAPHAGFDPVTNDVRVARAVQASTGVEWTPSPVWMLDAAVYTRVRGNADGLTAIDSNVRDEVRLSPDTYDLAYGLELIARRPPVGKLYGWVSYTLSRSEVRFLDALDGSDRPQNGPFDQRHILTILASYALPKRWRLGGRFRLVSGSPFTDVVGTIDLLGTAGVALIEGQPNAGRFPVFHQLDLRVDKVWVKKRVLVTTYVDVQNVYNRANVEAYIYDISYRERFSGLGLPIFPSFGFRIDF